MKKPITKPSPRARALALMELAIARGGALNAYLSSPKGETQGDIKGSCPQAGPTTPEPPP